MAVTTTPFPAYASAAVARPSVQLDQIIAPLTQDGAPGCTMGLSRNGERLVEHSFGLADLEHAVPNTFGTVLEAGSASKQVTAAAILLLAEDGKLSLTDDVRRHLPELPDYGKVITVDHLLTNTSGLRDWRFVLGLAGAPLGTKVHSNADALSVAARQRGLNHPPGSEYAYTNTGFSLAAIIVERVSGRSLAEFSRTRLFEPLGMRSTQWRDDHRRVVKGRGSGYSRAGAGWLQDMPFENAYGAGGLLTTAGDLLTWNEALQADRLGPAITRQLEERTILEDGVPSVYARGLFIDEHRGTREVGHGGVTAGYRAWTGRYPQYGIAVAVLCNGNTNPAQLARDLVDLHLPAAAVAVPANTSAPPMMSRVMRPPAQQVERWRPSASELEAIEGVYWSEEAGATYRAIVENGRLVLKLEGSSDQTWILSPTTHDTFVFPHGKVNVVRSGQGEPCQLHLNAERLRDFPLFNQQCLDRPS